MTPAEALQPAIIYLGAGLAAAFASRAARLSPVIGYLIAGVFIGPSGFRLVAENETTHFLAELGVVFLLFDIGLHFSLREIQTRRTDILGLAPLQIVLCGLGFAAVGLAVGFEPPIAGVVGASLALSSTAVVSRLLSDRNQPGCPIGRSATAILVAQDLVAIFILVFAAALRGAPDALGLSLIIAVFKALVGLAVALVAGRFIVRPVFDALARTNNQEAFTVVALFIVLAASAASANAGLALTTGAFLAGMALSETPYRHVVQSEVKPFQSLLLGLFFMSVGMNVNLPLMLSRWPAVLLTALTIMILKTALIILAARLARWSVPGATQLGFLLSQGSEFTLVIVGIQSVALSMSSDWSSLIVTAVAVTLIVAPVWTAAGVWLAHRLAERAKANPAPTPEPEGGPPVIILGMTREGRLAADALKDHHLPYIGLDSDPQRFVAAASDGYAVVYGDARDMYLLDQIGKHGARALVIGDPHAEPPSILARAHIGAPIAFAAAETAAARKQHLAAGHRVHMSLAEPRGVELVADLLAQLGVDQHEIAVWIADQTERRGLTAQGPDTETEVA
ncbi:MAG: cation:proton antiporter [Hyphomonadaceae bacterium]